MNHTPVPQWQGPHPAHSLTLTLTAAREGGYDVDARCACPFPGPLRGGRYGWAGLYGAESDDDLDTAVQEAVYHWGAHREDCARRFGPGALL